MQRFFDSIADIHHFSLCLRCTSKAPCCQHCHKQDQWVSHGFIYKQITIDTIETVGKRIVCSNRFGRTGCGHTYQLYCSHRAPRLHYSLCLCIGFVITLLANKSSGVELAYCWATGAHHGRNAWRWLNRMSARISAYRTFVLNLGSKLSPAPDNTISPLLSTLKQLTTRCLQDSASHFQLKTQNAFI